MSRSGGRLDPTGVTDVLEAVAALILGDVGATVGFYGTAPIARAAAYTQTYSTATRTHANPTAAAVATTAASLAGYGFTQAQANALPAAINALVIDLANTKQVLNRVLDDLQLMGLLA